MGDIHNNKQAGTAPLQGNTTASAPPEDHIVTTEHSAVIRGQKLDYTATTGTMVVETAGKKCEIFFTRQRSEPRGRIGPPPDICFQWRAGFQLGVDAYGILRAAPHCVR